MKKGTLKKVLCGVALTLMLGFGVSAVASFTSNGNIASADNFVGVSYTYKKVPYNKEIAEQYNIKDKAQWDRIQDAEANLSAAVKEARGQRAMNDLYVKHTDFLLKEGVMTEERARLEKNYASLKGLDIKEETKAYIELMDHLVEIGEIQGYDRQLYVDFLNKK